MLRCKPQSGEIRQLMKEHCRNSKDVKTFAQYKLFSMSQYKFQEYITLHLKYEIIMFIIEHVDDITPKYYGTWFNRSTWLRQYLKNGYCTTWKLPSGQTV